MNFWHAQIFRIRFLIKNLSIRIFLHRFSLFYEFKKGKVNVKNQCLNSIFIYFDLNIY